MKRSLGSSDSLGALMSICPTTAELSPTNNHVYSIEFQSMLDGLDEEGHVAEKKRRLSVDQVKALEKNFAVENKLEPNRKVKLAQELGLEPRQVAVWFQNRRARWKTKQLESDYGFLKTSYETLKLSFDTLEHDNEALREVIGELKANLSVKGEMIVPETEEREQLPVSSSANSSEPVELIHNSLSIDAILLPELKDGSSDSDSSAILNEKDTTANYHHAVISSPSSMNCLELPKTTYLVKLEEHNFFSTDEACNFFFDEQGPSLEWCYPEQWN
ncbi:Alanine--glyoxylate aminotransferase 2 isoform 3 [Hibiscus syriacus]|uniref:Homeobox-leucine zipper protein n=2 Tax=Hibiscus syriacus TaxID=106335 RepID=A0A6A2ZVU0_HIBSY|nr:homeobox-leucine zipper protein ATHB-6-like isoform X2 [Hibiscus syriacus]XP_039009630.1 homeobox-leucine zipper protein ATHB-6-like isoform X2 [Hibiscus syriacus]XP_039009631.1 homeobox-leucine zipper protein ATHB-6-like isoform X2 [Hibiscus syriacus]KAE8696008.1 Alanine--glyoxylate aminotransferase 2 isoform 3 [Hibiscus syriacus]